jgi:hypothetical protein
LVIELNIVRIVPIRQKVQLKEAVPVQLYNIVLRNQTLKTFTRYLDNSIQLLEINNQSLTISGSESVILKINNIRKLYSKGYSLLYITSGKTIENNTNSYTLFNNPTILLDPLDNSYFE